MVGAFSGVATAVAFGGATGAGVEAVSKPTHGLSPILTSVAFWFQSGMCASLQHQQERTSADDGTHTMLSDVWIKYHCLALFVVGTGVICAHHFICCTEAVILFSSVAMSSFSFGSGTVVRSADSL